MSRRGRRNFLFVLFGSALSAPVLCAQTAPEKTTSSNRCLLVVATSKSMQRRAEAVQNIVGNLLVSGMSGQLRPGDTIGIWTFNEDLYAGQFPLQQWSPGTARAIAVRAVEFLQNQKYEKASRLDKVLVGMNRLIKDSDLITIFLFSDGREKISGTPFDDKINTAYQKWQGEQERQQMPFITVLRAKAGQITDYVVNTPPWPLQLPPLPAESKPAKAQATAPPRIAPPVIISGRKPSPATPSLESPAANSTPPASAVISGPEKSEPALLPAATTAPEVSKAMATQKSNTGSVTVSAPVPVEAKPAGLPAQKPGAAIVDDSSRRPAEAVAPKIEAIPSGPKPPVVAATPAAETTVLQPPPESNAAALQNSGNLSSTSAVPVAAAVTVPPKTPFNHKSIWIVGLVMLAGAAGLGVFLMRRSRASPPASLITRSLDRKK